MKGEPFVYGNLVVYPEYCGFTIAELCHNSRCDDRYYIAAFPYMGENLAGVFRDGKMIYHRAKHRLHPSEVDLRPGRKPEIVNVGGQKVLILICYEIVFPVDYMSLGSVDVVVHMVGMPMFDENQREGWVALQKVVSIIFKCPVVCCCGGEKGRMNISGVIDERENSVQ